LGIKVSQHRSYHGLALNVDMDLAPFMRINPCGYAGLQTVDMKSLGVRASWHDVAALLATHLQRRLAA
ncbi:MAG: lipoyl(octanoyl) transferase, partial [Rubrivivax sp.]|nr:lipoyl(octanoyl) transferase [Rubrivivax sp.]